MFLSRTPCANLLLGDVALLHSCFTQLAVKQQAGLLGAGQSGFRAEQHGSQG